MTRKFFVVVAVLVVASISILGQSKPSIQGVWRVVETSGGRSGGTKTPQPGLVIFTARHYAIVRDTALKPRARPKDISNATPAEALAAYQYFMAQAGTYEVKENDTLEMRASVAKNPPPYDKYTEVAIYRVKIEGSNLSLTILSKAFLGNLPDPEAIRLTRLE